MFVADPVLDAVVRGIALTAMAVGFIVLLVRVNGLRSFSKMTSFDFLMTLAVASLLASASQSTGWTGFGQALIAIAVLFLVQYLVARLSILSDRFQDIVHNRPQLLMHDGILLRDALDAHNLSEKELFGQLRAHGVNDVAQVRAVVIETTGDISVLTGTSPSPPILHGVRGKPADTAPKHADDRA